MGYFFGAGTLHTLSGLQSRHQTRGASGLAFAIFYTKVHNRVLRPLLATDAPACPPALRAAVRTINTHIDARLAHERLTPAA